MDFKDIRRKLGLTQVEMSSRFDINQATISKMENGGNISIAIKKKLLAQIDWLKNEDFINIVKEYEVKYGGSTIAELEEKIKKLQRHNDILMEALGEKLKEDR